ncbi:MAG: hypothetical protein HY381_01770 [Candidatus Chisholmbacteria bacterium]|nr:hypothetical protein [Candidatus Chisholmbacteria bacterium]
MPTRPSIFILTGKPTSAPGGYQTYADSLVSTLHHLGYSTRIFSAPPLPQPLTFLPILSLVLALKIIPHLKSQTIIIGIGPWTLAGALLKLIFPRRVILIATYFTTIKHEFAGSYSEILSHPYPLLLKLQYYFASFTLIPLYSLLEKFTLFRADYILTHYLSTESILKREFGLSKFTRLPYV